MIEIFSSTRRELGLELREVLGREQLRVVLGEQQRRTDRGAKHRLDRPASRRSRVIRRNRARARRRHVLERLALMPGVARDGLGEARHQIVPEPQRDVDLRPRALARQAQLNKAVVGHGNPQRDQGDDGQSDDYPQGHGSNLRQRLDFRTYG